MQRQPGNFGPVNQKPVGRNWLPLVLGASVALALVCALAFVIFAVFFFTPKQPQVQALPTATRSVVAFVTAAPGEQAQPVQPAAEATTAPVEAATTAPVVEPAAQPTPAPAEQPAPAATQVSVPSSGLTPMASPDYGIQAFLYWRGETADRDLKLINDIKFTWVKQEIPWREIEGAGKGVFDWGNTDRMMDQIDAHGLKMIARISTQPEWAGGGYPELGPPNNYQDMADFLTALATRYKGRIDAYQIWNEPNLAREWGNRPPSPAEYTELLKVAYQAIKAVDPQAWVITAGLAPTTRHDDVAMPETFFVQGLYDAGAKPYFDALGVHAAGYKAPPATDPAEVARDPNLANPGDFAAGVPEELRRIYCFRHIEDLRAIMVKNGDEAKRVVILEFGWTVDNREGSPYAWHAVTESEQAKYIVGAYKYAQANWQPWIGAMSLIYIASPDWGETDEQTYWSITYPNYPDFKARPAYWGLMEMAKLR